MGIARTAAASALTLLLGACGGGGGGGSDDGGHTDAAGFYVGGLDSPGRAGYALILPDGTLWTVYSTTGNDAVIAGFVRGRIAAAGGDITDGSGRDYNFEGLGVSTISDITGNYVPQDSLAATVRFSGGTTFNIAGTYDPSFEDVPTRAVIQGDYEGTVGSPEFSDQIVFSISSDGSISGASLDFDCNFEGHADPRPDANAYDLEISFEGGTECAAPGETVEGVAILNTDVSQLLGALVLDDRSSGALFIADKL